MIFWLWLVNIYGIGPKLQELLLARFSSPEAIYHATTEELLQIEGIGPAKAKILSENRSLDNAKKILADCNAHQISVLLYDSAQYPDKLRKKSEISKVLFYKGNINILSNSMTAVIGARRCSRKGKELTIQIVEELVGEGQGIVSGMAKGIDSYAHTVCLNHSGKTIAVLGNGLDICYPKEHALLMKRIEEQGLLLSEYPPGYRPTRYSFPARNRLIAAIADHVVIPEANRGSGAMITADYAREFGIPITMPDTVNKLTILD